MRINDAYDYLVHLIACIVNEDTESPTETPYPQSKTPLPLPDGVSYEQVLECGILHDVAGFAYLGALKAAEKPDAATLDKWKQRYYLGIGRNAEQEEARAEILSALHGEGIATLELQGTKMKHYYPSPDLRMMGDIDFIVEKKHIEAAERLVRELGYETTRQGDFEVDGTRGSIHIEVHSDFFSETYKFYKIINNPFGYAQVDGELNASVPDRIFILYNLLHLLKHYHGHGIGIRRMLDLYYIDRIPKSREDEEYIESVLSENGFGEDMKDLRAVSELWFCGKDTERNTDGIIQIMKSAGTQGNMKISTENRLKDIRKADRHFPKLRYFLSLAFPPKAQIYSSYPACKERNYPTVICWLYRAVRIPFKPGRLRLFVIYVKSIFQAKLPKDPASGKDDGAL